VRLGKILSAFNSLEELVVFPVHPRTNKAMKAMGFSPSSSLRLIDPVSYLDMVQLMKSARMILTDSGGVQKEAYWLSVPCVTLRDETEWVETVQEGWNVLAGTETDGIINAVDSFQTPGVHPILYGDGQAAKRCVSILGQGLV
jgi:UDP-GlcNAc3NAcA epimerase